MYKRLYEEEHSLHLSHTHSSDALAGYLIVYLLPLTLKSVPSLLTPSGAINLNGNGA